MSLYDKLSPEALKVVEREMELYPNLTRKAVESMKNTDFVTELKMGDALSISTMFSFELSFNNLYEFFK